MSSFLTSEEERARKVRRRVVFTLAAATVTVLAVFFLLTLRRLILPVLIGSLFAYICRPLIAYLRHRGMPGSMAIFTLFAGFCLLLYTLISLGARVIPDKKGELELQIRARYKLNQRYEKIMGLDHDRDGNIIYAAIGREVAPLMASIDRALMLSAADHKLVVAMHRQGEGAGFVERYWQYHLQNRKRDRGRIVTTGKGQSVRQGILFLPGPERSGILFSVLDAVSLWLLTPLVFLILLFDHGRLRKGMVRLVPNRYFELTLTVSARINQALGRYLRGTALECFLVGTSFFFCFVLIGLDLKWAATIGIVAGLANAIPFLGPAIGLAVGLLYAIMAEDVHPILPFSAGDDLLLAVVAVVALVQLIDNALFQPYILGGAVDLHPLAVTIGVIGGAILFGFGGMLLAVPVMMIFRVIVSTLFEQMRAYQII